MSNERNPIIDPRQPMVYQIRIKGHLSHQWTDWFEGLTITLEEGGNTLVRCRILPTYPYSIPT